MAHRDTADFIDSGSGKLSAATICSPALGDKSVVKFECSFSPIKSDRMETVIGIFAVQPGGLNCQLPTANCPGVRLATQTRPRMFMTHVHKSEPRSSFRLCLARRKMPAQAKVHPRCAMMRNSSVSLGL